MKGSKSLGTVTLLWQTPNLVLITGQFLNTLSDLEKAPPVDGPESATQLRHAF